jgi:hypothetical protein
MLHLHVFLWLKSLHTFYSLLILLITCEHYLVGNPSYLSHWWMRYSRMTWLLLFHCKVLGIYFTKLKIQTACSLNEIQIPTKAIYDCSWQNLPHMPLTLVLSLVKFCDPYRVSLHAPKIKTHVHVTNNQLFLHWEHATTCISIHKINTPCFTNTISLAYFRKRHHDYAKRKRMGYVKVPKYRKKRDTMKVPRVLKKWWAHEGSWK